MTWTSTNSHGLKQSTWLDQNRQQLLVVHAEDDDDDGDDRDTHIVETNITDVKKLQLLTPGVAKLQTGRLTKQVD